MKISVVVPTYQEKDNIKRLIERIASALNGRDYEIVVVDDNSPDGTAQVAVGLAQAYPVRVIKRKGKLGLGSAIMEGFKNSSGELVGVIDADLQHPPELIRELCDAIEEGSDIAIASRYVPGGGMENWPVLRRAVSKGATLLARPLTRVKDPMSGYFFLNGQVIEGERFTPTGYKLLLEILTKADHSKVKEVPYIFRERQAGQSKLALSEYAKYLRLLSRLYLDKVKGQLLQARQELRAEKKEQSQPLSRGNVRAQPSLTGSDPEENKLSVSIGVCAYNEEANIGELLQALQSQIVSKADINQIIVVSSGCTDKTDEIVESFQQGDPRIELVKQSERSGKASAVNQVLQASKGDVCVLVSADVVPLNNTIEHLCLPFCDQTVGMTGGHPIPVNDPKRFMGFVSHLIWDLAHQVSLIEPKLGELIAFRNVVKRIPEDTAVDEASIEAEVKEKGYHLKYVSEALVYNRGPDTVSDFIKQRRRIYAGHLHLKKTTGHEVSSMSFLRLARLVLSSVKPNWRSVLWTPAAAALEFYTRLLGAYDFYIKKRNPYIWDIVSSTKVVERDIK